MYPKTFDYPLGVIFPFLSNFLIIGCNFQKYVLIERIIATTPYSFVSSVPVNNITSNKKRRKNKTIEYLYALSVTRKEIYVSKLLVALCAVFFVVLSVGIAGIIFGFASGSDTFSMVDMSAVIKITETVPFFFAALGLFLSSLSSKYVSSGLGAGIVMLTYMLGYLGKLLEDKADFLKYFSPFELLSPTNALALSGETYGAFGVIAALTVILLVVASIAYKKRDFSL